MNKDWMAGFINGEGYFGISVPHGKYPCLSPQFAIGLRLDDKEILEEIRKALGVTGKVSICTRHDIDTYQAILMVNGSSNCLRLINYLDDNPFLGTKRPQYAIWKKAVYYYRRNLVVGSPNPERRKRRNKQMETYDKLLRGLKKYSGPKKTEEAND